MTIRPAVAADIPRIVEMGQRFMAETVYRDRIADSPDDLVTFAHRLIGGTDSVLFVAESDQRHVVGMIGLWVFRHPFSGERIASELAWWVDPEARSTSAGKRLLKAAESWATEAGAVTLHMIAPTANVEQFYERVGYTRVEVTYERRLQ